MTLSFGLKRILISGIIGLALAGVAAALFYTLPNEGYITEEVLRGTIQEEVSASGKVESPLRLNLFFRGSARLISHRVSIGDTVAKGDVIAEQDSGDVQASVDEARAQVDLARSKLYKLQLGARDEEVQIASTALLNAIQGKADAHQLLRDAIQDSYAKADDALFNKADQLFISAKTANPRLNFSIPDSRLQSSLESGRVPLGQSIAEWFSMSISTLSPASNVGAETDIAIEKLSMLASYLSTLSDALSLAEPYGSLTQTTLDKWKTDISSARAALALTVTAVSSNLKAYQAAEGAESAARDQKGLVTAPVRDVDVQAAEAEIRQAQARLSRSLADLEHTVLVSPVSGTVVDTHGNVGELVGPSTIIAALFPEKALEIELNVSENDIVKVSLGQKALISLDAFGAGTFWNGEVIHIDPAETVIGGSVYYKTKILFENTDARVRSGMTADVLIQTASKDSVLRIPGSALREEQGSVYVDVLAGDHVSPRKVETGVRDKRGMVEIISGLTEHELVVTGVR